MLSNRKLIETYSERFVNTANFLLGRRKSELGGIFSYITRMSSDEKQVKCLHSFRETMKRGYFFLVTLETFSKNRLQILDDSMLPTRRNLLAELDKTINSLQIEEDSQEFAFRPLCIEEIYDKHIVLKGNFEILQEDSPTGHPTQRGRLFYDLILPFHNKKSSTGLCFETKNLPIFYRYQF